MTTVDPERWSTVARLLDAALDVDPERRASFLEQACAGDDDLRAMVEALLAADRSSSSFMDVPALDYLAELLEDPPPE